MATSPWYREGAAKFTQGSTTVTGTGTRWVDFVRAGDGIQGPDGKLYQVTNVASNTSMSITPAYGSETTYWTIPIQGYVKRLADAASQLVRDFEGGADEALDAADRAKQSAIEASVSEAAALSQANRAESEADRAETEADRSQQAADDAVAVVSGGEASIDPEAGKIPIAGAEASIKQGWIENLQFELDALRVAKNRLLYGDGPYPMLDFQFQGAKYLDPRIGFSRASKDWDEYGNECSVNEPVLTEKGLWTSGERVGLITDNRDPSQQSWLKGAARLTRMNKYYPIETTSTGPYHGAIRKEGVLLGEGWHTITVEGLPVSGWGLLRLASSGQIDLRIQFDNQSYTVLGNSFSTQHKISLRSKSDRVTLKVSFFRPAESTMTISVNPLSTPGSIVSEEGSLFAFYQIDLKKGEVSSPVIPTEGSQVVVASSAQIIPLDKLTTKNSTFIIDFTPVDLSKAGSVTGFFGLDREGQTNAISCTCFSDNMRMTFYGTSGNSSFTLFGIELGRKYKLAIVLEGNKLTVWSGGEKVVEGEFLREVENDFNALTLGNHRSIAETTKGMNNFHSVSIYDSVLPESYLIKLTEEV